MSSEEEQTQELISFISVPNGQILLNVCTTWTRFGSAVCFKSVTKCDTYLAVSTNGHICISLASGEAPVPVSWGAVEGRIKEGKQNAAETDTETDTLECQGQVLAKAMVVALKFYPLIPSFDPPTWVHLNLCQQSISHRSK